MRRVSRKKSTPKNSEEPSDVHPSGLNEEQLAAVHAWDRPVLVQAGPGTGKTRTLDPADSCPHREPTQPILLRLRQSRLPAKRLRKCGSVSTD